MLLLKQSEATAARRRVPVVLVDDTDGKTAETGITLSAGDLKISKAGGAEANHAGTLTELAGGDYFYEFTQSELDTLGYISGRIVKAGVRTFRIAAQVVALDPYDAVRAGLTALPNAAAEAAGGLYTRGSGTGQINQPANGRIDARVMGMDADVLTAAALGADAVTEIQTGLATSANQTTILNRLGAWTGTGINTILGGIRALAAKAASLTPSDLSSGTTFDNTTDSTEAIRDRGDSAWGGAGSADWTSDERNQIRQALGVTGTTASTSGSGLIDLVKAQTDKLLFDGSNFVYAVHAAGSSSESAAVSTDDVANIQTIRSQTLARLVEITAQPKPTYNVDGQMFDHAGYLARLRETLDWCDRILAGYEPFEETTQGIT